MIGSRIGHYEITAEIGRGGMGEVSRFRDAKLNRNVALKILLRAAAKNSHGMARFECGISKSLSGREILAESCRC